MCIRDSDSSVQNGKHSQKVFRKSQSLCHIQSEKIRTHHVGNIQDHRDGYRFEDAPVFQQTRDQLAIFPQHMGNGYSLCLFPADFALLRFMAKPESNERFYKHRQRKENVQHPYHRYNRIRADK